MITSSSSSELCWSYRRFDDGLRNAGDSAEHSGDVVSWRELMPLTEKMKKDKESSLISCWWFHGAQTSKQLNRRNFLYDKKMFSADENEINNKHGSACISKRNRQADSMCLFAYRWQKKEKKKNCSALSVIYCSRNLLSRLEQTHDIMQIQSMP